MADSHARAHLQLLEPPQREPVPVLGPLDPGYRCSVCDSAWTYQAVRNTGRCPECGSGLLRDGDLL